MTVAKQWATMLGEFRNRGLTDALIVCCDGLRRLPESIRMTWPDATVQTCVVHMVRNSHRYALRKHWSPQHDPVGESEPSHSFGMGFRCPHLCRWRAQKHLAVRGYWSELDLMVSVPVRFTVT